jgi:pyruvate dehydrogenase E2 component (dihydrolipoamide acetyltransferase)
VSNSSIPAGIKSLKINIEGHRTHYYKAGTGTPVILVHGGASDARDWLYTMEALADRFSFYAPDLIGFGQTDRKESGYYLSDFSKFLVQFIDAMQIKKPALVGHSFGARVCLDTALLSRENVSKLVLIDASGLGKISGFGSALFNGYAKIRTLQRKPQPFPRFLAKEGEDYNNVSDEALRKLTTPTLLVWKQRDPYLPVSIARKAVKIIPGAKLTVFPGYGHAPHKQNRDTFNRLLLDFLGNNKAEKT